MKLQTALFTLLVIGLATDHVDAGWKFWKSKKKDDETTTTTTTTSSTTPVPVITNPSATNNGKPANTSPNTNTNKALASAADPGLAIGVGNTGTNIRGSAQPLRPNPGTDVGLDISRPKPVNPGVGGNSGQGYRDWAADLTGAGDRRTPSPKLPAEGPALFSGGQQPAQGIGGKPTTPTSQPVQPANRPTSPTRSGLPIGQPIQPSSTARPAQGTSTATTTTTTTTKTTQGNPNDGKGQVSTLNIGSLSPGSRPGSPIGNNNQQGSRPGSPSSPTGSTTSSGGKSWAEIAATGSRPGSPTPAPRPGSASQPAQSGQPGTTTPGQTSRPSQVPVKPYGQPGHQGSQQPGQSGLAAGAGTAAAAGAAAGTAYTSNPTYSKGNTITNEDLKKLSESLYIKDTNNAFHYITINLQKQTSGSNTNDQAPQPLLTVRPEALRIPTIQKVYTLYDNYESDIRTHEYVSPAERQEESLLVDTFLSTNVMSAAMRFLADKGIVRKDYYDYKDTLRRIWFNVYSRGEGKIGSSGFEHVFLAETDRENKVIGFHNWIYLNAEETKNHADYLGYIKKVDLGNKGAIVKAHVKLNGIDKPVTTLFVGTSPELEMALYTVCFFARPDAACPVSLGGTEFDIKTFKFRYKGKDLIGAAFPDI